VHCVCASKSHMSLCIIARCARTGNLGLGVGSENLSIGMQCDGAIRPRIGATLTLGATTPANNRLTLNLLAQGYSPQSALAELRANDPAHAQRLIAILDREGRAAYHRGTHASAAAACLAGVDCITMIDGAPGEAAARSLQASFASSADDDLGARILRALEAVEPPGAAGLRSVALVVYGANDYSDIDLRVDMHERPVAELRRLYDEYQPFGAYYDERAKNPRQALPQREFADLIERSRGGGS